MPFTPEELSELNSVPLDIPPQQNFTADEMRELSGMESMGSPAIAPQFDQAAASPESLAALQEARDMPWDKAMFKSAINEGTNLFQRSRNQFRNQMGGQQALAEGARADMARNDAMGVIARERPWPTGIGAMLPYLQPGARLYKGMEGALTGALKNSPTLTTKLARNPTFVGGLTGLTEGGIVAAGKEQNVPMGAALGALFGGAGGKFADWATKTVLPLTDTMKDALKIIDEEKMIAGPGARSNLKKLQQRDASMALNPKTSEVSDAINDFNNEKLTRMALRDTGIDADNVSPDVLRNKYTEYRQGFEDLTRRSTGRLDNQMIEDFNDAIRTYENSVDSRAGGVVQKYHDMVYDVIDDVDGETIPGDQFQDFYSSISEAIGIREGVRSTTANAELRALKDIRSAVDDNIERHMPTTERAKNKELRRNYAAIKILQEGDVIDRASGRINPKALDAQLNKRRNRQSYQEMNPKAPLYNLYKAARAGIHLENQAGASLASAQELSNALRKEGDMPENLKEYFKGKGQSLTMGESIRDTLYRAGYPDITGGLSIPGTKYQMPSWMLPYIQSQGTTTGLDVMKGIYGDPNSGIQKSAAYADELLNRAYQKLED